MGPEFLPAAAQVFAQVAQVHRLAAVLVGGHAGDDLGGDGAGHLEGLGAFDELAVHHGAVFQHVPDVDQAAVEDGLDEVVGVVEVDGSLVVGLGDVLGQKNTPGQVPAHLSGDVIPLGGGDHGVFIGVLLGQLLVFVAQQGQDGFVGGIGLPDQRPVVAVDDIGLGQVELVPGHQPLLHQVLDVLHQHAGALLALDAVDDGVDVRPAHPLRFRDFSVGLFNRGDNFAAVVVHTGAVPFNNLHSCSPLIGEDLLRTSVLFRGAPIQKSKGDYSTPLPLCPLHVVAFFRCLRV